PYLLSLSLHDALPILCAQHSIAQAVKSTDPHTAQVQRKHGRHAGKHLARGLIGKGYRQQRLRSGQPVANQPGHTRGEYTRLAARSEEHTSELQSRENL